MRRSVALLRNDFLPLLPESPALDLAYRLVAVLDEASAHARRLRSPQPPGINFRHLTHHCLAPRNPSRPLPPGPVGPADPPAAPRRAPPGPWLPCSSRWPSSRPRGPARHGRHKTIGLGFLFSVILSSPLCSATVPCKGWRRLSGQKSGGFMRTFGYGVPWPSALLWPPRLPHQHFETETKDPRGLSVILMLYDFITLSEREKQNPPGTGGHLTNVSSPSPSSLGLQLPPPPLTFQIRTMGPFVGGAVSLLRGLSESLRIFMCSVIYCVSHSPARGYFGT